MLCCVKVRLGEGGGVNNEEYSLNPHAITFWALQKLAPLSADKNGDPP